MPRRARACARHPIAGLLGTAAKGSARAQDASFNITLEGDLDPAVAPFELAPQEITRVFLNLFGNGFYAANKRSHG